MKVTVTLELEHTMLAKLAELLEEKPEEEKPKKSRKRVVEEVPTAIEDPTPAAVEELAAEPAKEITDAEVRAEAAKLLRAGKQPELKALLDKYGVARATSLPQEQRKAFLKDLEALNE